MKPEFLLQARASARTAHAEVDAALLALHERAVRAMEDPGQREYVQSQALRRVDQWEARDLCHGSYVTIWRELLDLPAAALAARVLGGDSDAVALRQNSPFGFLAVP